MANPAKNRRPTKQNNVDSLMDLWEVIPNDDEDMPFVSVALLVAEAGTFRLRMYRGTEVTVPLALGWHLLRVSRVFASGTTGKCFAGD